MMLLAIVLISHAAAYKVHSNEAKVVKEDPIPHRYEDTSGLCTQHLDCKRLVAEWGCDITWAETCPHTTHPLGAEFAIEALNKYCPLQCKELADGHDNTDPNAKIKRKAALMQHTANCLNQKAKEAKGARNPDREDDLKRIMEAEAMVDAASLGGPTTRGNNDDDDSDPEEQAAVQKAGRDAALHVAMDDFNGETDKMFGAIKINDKAINKYSESVKTLSHSCADDEDADEIADDEAYTLKRAAKRDGLLTEFEAEDGMSKANFARSECNDKTFDTHYFVGELTSDHNMHCGSALIQTSHREKLHEISHHVEYHAKAALVLHDESNRLAHHFAAHVQTAAASSQSSTTNHSHGLFHKVHEVAKSNLTAKQISRLHKLDDRHYEKLHGQSKMRSCEQWSEMQEKDPDHWFINHEGAASYIDCLCEAKEPSLVCYARYKSGIQSAMLAFSEKLSTSFDVPPNRVAIAKQLKNPKSEGGFIVKSRQDIVEEHGLVLAQEIANRTALPIGPCDIPFECEICQAHVCHSVPFPDTKKDAMAEVENRMKSPDPPCMSGRCDACVGVKPGDFLAFKAGASWGAQSCGNVASYMSTFAFHIHLSLCLGGRAKKLLEAIGLGCMELFTASYYPYIGVLVPAQLNLNFVIAQVSVSVTVPVHDLSPAVTSHCNREASAPLVPAGRPTGSKGSMYDFAIMLSGGSREKMCADFFWAIFFQAQCPSATSKKQKCLADFHKARGRGRVTLEGKILCFWGYCTIASHTWYL